MELFGEIREEMVDGTWKKFIYREEVNGAESYQPAAGIPSISKELLCALRDLAEYSSRNYCTHEETYRGGVLWEICTSCGVKWADDEGGMPKDAREYPPEIKRAFGVLEKFSA